MRSIFSGVLSVLLLSFIAVSCSKEKSLELGQPSTPGSGGTAIFVLSASGGNCVNAAVNGVYKKGTGADASNTVDIEVNVNTVGTWSMNTGSVAGFYFSGAGSFTNTGTQVITLNALGSPNADGQQLFNLVAGGTTCSFAVTVLPDTSGNPNPPPTGPDFFPMTQNSWWSYDDFGDTIKTVVSGTSVIGGKTYTNFVDSYEGIPDTDTSFYRKDNATGFYYMNEDLSMLSALGITMPQPRAEVLLLKSGMAAGDSWNTDLNGTASGFPVTVRFKVDVVSTTASLTVGTNNFTNVRHITVDLLLGTAGTFTSIATPIQLYYAPGVGLVRTDDGMDQTDIRYWNVL